jgi:hypothetical protein
MYNDPNQSNPNQQPYNPNQPQQPYNPGQAEQPYQQPYNPNQAGQPYNPNQAGQPYPPQGFMPPPQPPKKKRSKLGIGCGVVAALIILIVIIVAVTSNSGSSTASTSNTGSTPSTGSTTTASSTPKATAKPLVWTTVKTFTGTGSEKTDTFSAPDNWKLSWKCDPKSFDNIQYNVVATINDASDSMIDSGVNALCKPGTTSGSTNVTSGGTVRLDIISEGDWVFNIQEQK